MNPVASSRRCPGWIALEDMMQAWVEDAQLLTEESDFSRSQSVLLRTSAVSDFLNEVRSSCALVAPKGFGKTFILKMKRVSLQRSGYRCLPKDNIVDRPRNRPPTLATGVADLMERSENWETIWQAVISLSIINSFRDEIEIKNQLINLVGEQEISPIIKSVLVDRLESCFDILQSFLDANRSELLQIFRQTPKLTRIFSGFHLSAAVFIDSIDEYLQHYVEFGFFKKTETHRQKLRIWHNGQIGAWTALRRLQGINPHLKIYASLRKEAYHFASSNEPDFANLRSFRRELKYTRENIKQIIMNNIKVESAERLSDRNNIDPFLKFVGPKNEYISNSGTGKQELTIDYWIRHCSMRPRDAVAIGSEISKMAIDSRNRQTIRTAVNNCSAERVQALFNEASPFFDSLQPDFYTNVLGSNVMTFDELKKASLKYEEMVGNKNNLESDEGAHPFCTLYSIGLLGIVHEDRDNAAQLIQSFPAVGETPLGSVHIMPHAERYLIHPSMSDFVVKKDVKFIGKLNKHNIVGHDLEWRHEEDIRFVAVGDIRSYRQKVMEKVGAAQTFDRFWKQIFLQSASNLDYAMQSGGDSLLLADRSPARVLRCADNISAQLEKSGYGLSMRIGLHSGFWRISRDETGTTHPEISEIVGVAARIEPLAHEGHMLISDVFKAEAERSGFIFGSSFEVIELNSEYFPERDYDSQKGTLISKPNEAEQWVKLYQARPLRE